MTTFGRSYTMLPPIPAAGVLDRYRERLGIIIPYARTNEILNPSGELNTTGYSGATGSTAQSATYQYHGAYSVRYTPGPGTTDYILYTALPIFAVGSTRAISCKFLGSVPGLTYTFGVATTLAAAIQTVTVVATGKWQYLVLYYTETSATQRYLIWQKVNSASQAPFYIDGVQCELCGTEGVFATTYIDGDQLGYVPNQLPVPYYWNGAPHASTSTRTNQTRAGGRIIYLQDYGFLPTSIIGLGMSAPRNEQLGFAQLDGAQYRNVIKTARSFSLVGRFQGIDPTSMDAAIARLGRLFDRDLVGTRQELMLCMQARECNADIGEFVTIPRSVYSSGLDGNVQELPVASVNITLQQYLPFVVGRDGGVALDTQDSDFATGTTGIMQRSPGGAWSTLLGMNGGVLALARGLDRTLYAGGNFLNAGGNANADYIGSWNGAAWTALPSGSVALNGQVNALAVVPSGLLYAGGTFTNASGIAAADYIASWNGAAWAALGTGMNAAVNALAVGPDGTLYAGGLFTTASGATNQYFAAWNGSAWSSLGSTTTFNNTINAVAVGPDGSIYVGGNFTNIGVAGGNYVAKWNGSAWASLGPAGVSGLSSFVNAIAVAPNGLVYVGGQFIAAGGLSIAYIAVWNGVQWAALGAGVNGVVNTLAFDRNGLLYVGGNFTTAGGVTLADRMAIWNGSAWVGVDLDLAGTPQLRAVLSDPDGTLTLGSDASAGTITFSGLATATNNGSAAAYPTVTFTGPSGGARLYRLANVTTGIEIDFNLTLVAGEVVTLVLDPTNLSFTSSFRGNLFSTILPGSQTAQFVLQPGANVISCFCSAFTTASMWWPTRYVSPSDALYQASDL